MLPRFVTDENSCRNLSTFYSGPGRSNHNFEIAWDVGIFKERDYIDDLIDKKAMTAKAVDAEYKKVGAYGKALGLFWGGDWSNPDYSHFQMRDNNELASLRTPSRPDRRSFELDSSQPASSAS